MKKRKQVFGLLTAYPCLLIQIQVFITDLNSYLLHIFSNHSKHWTCLISCSSQNFGCFPSCLIFPQFELSTDSFTVVFKARPLPRALPFHFQVSFDFGTHFFSLPSFLDLWFLPLICVYEMSFWYFFIIFLVKWRTRGGLPCTGYVTRHWFTTSLLCYPFTANNIQSFTYSIYFFHYNGFFCCFPFIKRGMLSALVAHLRVIKPLRKDVIH